LSDLPPIRFFKQIIREVAKGNISAVSYIKFYKRWSSALQPGSNSVADEQPWITFPAIDFLKGYINTGTKVFEYGGGGSTLFFVNRAKVVITVEHDKTWFNALQTVIANKKIANWQGNLIEPEAVSLKAPLDAADPDHYYTGDKVFMENTFKMYATAIDKYADEYFDIVLVDGRSRPSCIQHSLPKIKKGGLLILDNADRKYYLEKTKTALSEFELALDQYSPAPYTDFFTQTNIWIKK